MNFLPYSGSGTFGWIAAGTVSAVVHGAVVFGVLTGARDWYAPPDAMDRPRAEYQITLERLETDTLAGLVERLGIAGGADQPDTLDPAPEEEFDELAALAAEDAPPLPEPDLPEPAPTEELTPEAPEPAEPEPVEPDAPEQPAPADLPIEDPEPTLPEPVEAAQPELPETELPQAAAPDPVEAAPVEQPAPAPLAEDAVAAQVAEQAPVVQGQPLDLTRTEPLAPVVAPPVEAASPILPDASAEAGPGAAISALPPDDGAIPILPDTFETVAPVISAVPTTPGLDPLPEQPVESAAIVAPVAPEPEPVSPGADLAALPVAPETSAPEPVAPDASEPLAIAPESPAPLAVAPEAPEPLEIQPEALTGQSPRPAPPPPSAQDLALGDLIQRIRAAADNPCLLALPRRAGNDGAALALVAPDDAAMQNFSDEVLTGEDAAIPQTRTLVDPRQCAALTFVRQNRDYPATRIGLRLDTEVIPTGGRLSGVMRGTAGRDVALLLIDNNGVMQSLNRFLSFSGNFARFDVPMTRVGQQRDTAQLLLAIASPTSLDPLRERSGQLAETALSDLPPAIASQAALAIVTFVVE